MGWDWEQARIRREREWRTHAFYVTDWERRNQQRDTLVGIHIKTPEAKINEHEQALRHYTESRMSELTDEILSRVPGMEKRVFRNRPFTRADYFQLPPLSNDVLIVLIWQTEYLKEAELYGVIGISVEPNGFIIIGDSHLRGEGKPPQIQPGYWASKTDFLRTALEQSFENPKVASRRELENLNETSMWFSFGLINFKRNAI